MNRKIKWGRVILILSLIAIAIVLITLILFVPNRNANGYIFYYIKPEFDIISVKDKCDNFLEEKNEEQLINNINSSSNNYISSSSSEYLGVYYLTAYCPCDLCSEGYGHSTATGAYATEGITVAADPNVLPYGTHLTIDGHEYIVQDCGGGVNGNHIDIFVENHCDTFLDCYNGYHEVYIGG